MSDAKAVARALPARPSRRVLGLAILLGAGSAVFLFSQGLQPSDDAYITFRHARNLALHGWPAWNLTGTPVLGSTSPAWLLVLGLLGAVIGPEQIEPIALAANACLSAGIVVLAFLIALDLIGRPWPALLAAALVGFNSVDVYVFSLGFEAALLVAVVLGCLYALRRDRALVALLLASLAPLVRPEGLLLTPIVVGVLLRRGRLTRRGIAAFALLPLAWLIASSVFYGSPVPHSIVAKQNFPRVYRPYADRSVDLVDRLPAIPAATARMWEQRAQPVLFQGRLSPGSWSLRDRAHWWLALLGLVALAPALLRAGDRYVYALYPIGFLLLHGWLGTLAIWYLPSFVSLATLLLYAGAACLVERAGGRVGLGPVARGTLMLGACALFAAANQYTWRGGGAETNRGLLAARDPRGATWEAWERERHAGYRAAALELNERGTGATALISEVGVFGYFYDGPVLDAVGLCSPEALSFYPPPRADLFDDEGQPFTTANNIVPTRMVEELAPGYVVNSLTYLEHLVRPGTSFSRDYDKIADVGRAWDRPIAVYGRRSSADAPEPSGTKR